MKRLPPRSTRPDPLVPYATLSDLEIVAEGKAGSRRLLAILDDSPRYLNTALLLRLLCEVSAIVLVARLVSENLDGWWLTVGLSIGIMLLVSFVVIGVGPSTMGRQHSVTLLLLVSGPLQVTHKFLGPIRSEERRVGQAGVRACRSRWS